MCCHLLVGDFVFATSLFLGTVEFYLFAQKKVKIIKQLKSKNKAKQKTLSTSKYKTRLKKTNSEKAIVLDSDPVLGPKRPKQNGFTYAKIPHQPNQN